MARTLATLLVAVSAGAVFAGGLLQAADAPETRPGEAGRVLIVADDWKPMDVLAEFLRTRGGCTIVKAEQKDLPADLSAFAGVFMYIHRPMREPCERALVAYAKGGGRLIILHHGIASAKRANPAWLHLTGIAIPPRDHPTHPWRVIGNTTHTLVNLAPKHYVTTHRVTYDREVAYTSPDTPTRSGRYPALDIEKTEVFLNQQFTDGTAKTVLFGFMCTNPKTGKVIMQDRSGWLKRAGRGWVFYFQPGHCASDFANPNYAQIVLNALTWPGPETRPPPAPGKERP